MEIATGDRLSVDFLCSVFMVVVTGLVMIAYTARVLSMGRARFDRIERQGRSRLMPKGFMEGFYWLIQPVGNVLHRLGVSANQVTVGSLVFAVAAGVSFAFGFFGLACILITIGGMGDAVDGLLAQKSGKLSKVGGLLDSTVDRYSDFALLFGLAVYYRGLALGLVITLLAILGTFMVSYSSMVGDALRLQPPRGSIKRIERYALLGTGAGLAPFSIRWLEHPTAAGGVHAVYPMLAALVVIAVLANHSAVARTFAMAKQLDEPEGSDPMRGA